MRRAELVMAIALTAFSLYLMAKAAELPIGWIPKSGPGPGAFPFWLGACMLACCIWTLVKWVRRTSPASRSEEPYWDSRTWHLFLIGAVPLTIMIALVQVVGIYVALPLYLAFYIRYVGHHSWPVTGSIALISPVAIFLFFEIALKIELPKAITEPLFYPIYDLFY